ncbi:MAG: hypothetical protein F7C08_01190 [Desulfurococcales archaeon]|nr:hypothetical protein [Desulfurococcales archaeon]MCE4605133.1 hypothetical protein [Desulfurococcales archaeon]
MSAEERIPPTGEVKLFDSPRELFQYLDEEISRLRATLGELLRRLETAKAKAEMMTKLESILRQLSSQSGLSGTVLNLDTVNVYINPNPKQEYDVLVDLIRRMQDRIVYLERIRKTLEPLTGLGDVNISLEVVMINGVPKNIIVKM